jgi:hypothetical protein
MIDCQCEECRNERDRTFNWTGHEARMINARQKREEFRAKMADLGRSEETTFSSKVLEAYDLVHCPELRDSVLTTLQAIMTETEIRQGLHTGMLQVGWITQYGAGCIVDALRNKGYEITTINQK